MICVNGANQRGEWIAIDGCLDTDSKPSSCISPGDMVSFIRDVHDGIQRKYRVIATMPVDASGEMLICLDPRPARVPIDNEQIVVIRPIKG